jgi:hypothetical protein
MHLFYFLLGLLIDTFFFWPVLARGRVGVGCFIGMCIHAAVSKVSCGME